MSRANYYTQRRRRKRRDVAEDLVLRLVDKQRQLHPRMGTRKLLYRVSADLKKSGVEMGRDRLFELLRRRGRLIVRKARWIRTTDSRHGFGVYRNLLRDYRPTGPHQVWVSDLTYLRTVEGFVFAALVTDLYSRKIVGAHLADSLESVGCQEALKGAMRQLPKGAKPIHHSDRGTQYCCHEYVKRLKERGVRISMTEENHCYENATAERVNGILKQEYGLGGTLRGKAQARRTLAQAVELYNEQRPHLSLRYQTPQEVHQEGRLRVVAPLRPRPFGPPSSGGTGSAAQRPSARPGRSPEEAKPNTNTFSEREGTEQLSV